MLVVPAIDLSYALASSRDLKLHLTQVVHQALLRWRCHLLHPLCSDCLLVPLLALMLFHQEVLISFLAVRHVLKPILMLNHAHILTVWFALLGGHDRLILFSDNVILASHVVWSDVCWWTYLPPFVSRLGGLCWLTAQAVESRLDVEVLHLHLFWFSYYKI